MLKKIKTAFRAIKWAMDEMEAQEAKARRARLALEMQRMKTFTPPTRESIRESFNASAGQR